MAPRCIDTAHQRDDLYPLIKPIGPLEAEIGHGEVGVVDGE